MKQLLSATDFSTGGNNAVMFAAQYAVQSGATLHVLHAYKAQSSAATVFKGLNDILEQDARAALQGLVEELQQDLPALSVQIHAAFGEPDEVILRKAQELGADLVVVGTRGKSLLDNLFFGSTSIALSKRSGKPICLVPPSCSFDVSRPMVLATALRAPLSEAQLDFLHRLKAHNPQGLRLVHVFDDEHGLSEKKAALYQEIQSNLGLEQTDKELIQHEDVVAALLEHANQRQPAALLLHVYHYGFVEGLFVPSVAKALLHKIKVPLVLLPVI
jgi:nucleotide-binding universal stress UspA family protein